MASISAFLLGGGGLRRQQAGVLAQAHHAGRAGLHAPAAGSCLPACGGTKAAKLRHVLAPGPVLHAGQLQPELELELASVQ